MIFKIFFCEKTPMNVYILDWHVILLCIQEIELGNKLWTSPLQGTESFPFTLKWMEFEVNRQHHHLSKYRLSSRYSTLCILWPKYITIICSACFLNRKNVCQEWDVCRVFTLQHVLPGSRAHNMLKIQRDLAELILLFSILTGTKMFIEPSHLSLLIILFD